MGFFSGSRWFPEDEQWLDILGMAIQVGRGFHRKRHLCNIMSFQSVELGVPPQFPTLLLMVLHGLGICANRKCLAINRVG